MKPPIIQTQAGTIQGKWVEKDTIASFKGIPYAQPPVRELRWKAPQPLQKWEGIKKTTAFSASAWQQEISIAAFLEAIIDGQGWNALHRFGIKSLMKIAPALKQSEDCLYLNIKTPSVESTAKLPVMVWIHGGDHQDGSAAEPFYDGVAIPQQGIVLVTINYRLGLMGYFAHPDLNKETDQQVSGNYGTLDQIAALQWVQDNIASFGGDPDNVTIFGESAGGESVAHMLTTPLAKGLFHKAILQSPANTGQLMHHSQSFAHHDSAMHRGIQFAEAIGIKGENSAEQLRQLPAKEIMQRLRQQEQLNTFYPVIDGYVLPKSPFETFLDQEQHQVPILLGSNADEGTCIHALTPVPVIDYRYLEIPADQLPKQFFEDFGESAKRLLQLYPGLEQRNKQAEQTILGDSLFGAKARFYAEQAAKSGQATFFYHFKRVPPSATQTIGAYHAAELPFVHGTNTPVLPLNKEDKKLSTKMIAYWTTFAKTGQPNNEQCPTWEAFNPSDPKWMILDNEQVEMAAIGREEKYQLLNDRLLRQLAAVKDLRKEYQDSATV